mgnify:CR=1 FL=1
MTEIMTVKEMVIGLAPNVEITIFHGEINAIVVKAPVHQEGGVSDVTTEVETDVITEEATAEAVAVKITKETGVIVQRSAHPVKIRGNLVAGALKAQRKVVQRALVIHSDRAEIRTDSSFD